MDTSGFVTRPFFPGYAIPLLEQALRAFDAGQVDDAETMGRRALEQDPVDPRAIHLMGLIAMRRGRLNEAGPLMRQSIALRPGVAAFHNNLGELLRQSDDLEPAIACFREAIRCEPGLAEAHYNLGLSLRGLNRVAESIVAYRRAIEIKPQDPDFHFYLAIALLLSGNLQVGFEEYEWRWKCRSHQSPRWDYPQRQWRGEEIGGKTILLHAEQGFGDTLQFCRYVPLVVQRGANVVLQVQAGLEGLLHSLPGVSRVVVRGEPTGEFDVHCPLLSLPSAVGTTLQTIPTTTPYLKADSERKAHWRERLGRLCPRGRKVGLVWAGRSTHKNDRNRSIPLQLFSPIWKVTDLNFVSLQQGEPASQANDLLPELPLTTLAPLRDFAETAAVLANLDLLITVDTAIAHLGGAMGLPVWMLNPFLTDWRWMLERADSPWYPTMRIFRQRVLGHWDEVINELVTALAAFEL